MPHITASAKAGVAERTTTLWPFNATPNDNFRNIEFRVVAHDRVRHALKLEGIFWKILECASAESHERIGAYVSRIVAGVSVDGNKTSALRAHAAQWICARLLDISARSFPLKSLFSLVNATPVPCFVVAGSNAIECQNEAFLSYLRSFIGPVVDDAEIKINFRMDLVTLRSQLQAKPDGYVVDNVIMQSGERKQDAQARIIPMPAQGGQQARLIVYLLV